MLAPPPDLTVSQWADAKRRLSPEASAEPGRWDTRRAEYQRGIMDAISDPAVHTVVVMSSAQVGKTEIILNGLGFYIDQDPAPILVLQPTLEMGQAFSKDRLAPMLRDTPALQGRVGEVRSRDSGSTMLHKQFPGGHVTIAGANSPASLASRPIRVLLADEVDRYPASAGTEGDPVALARKRTTTFWNRKVVLVSTPTVKGSSRIEAAFAESDQRRFLVPCQDCGHEAPLSWSQVTWPEGRPGEATYTCPGCGVVWDDGARWRAMRLGRWEAGAVFNGVAGFHLSELYSPWKRLGETAMEFWEAQRYPERLQVWVNTALGETWEDRDGGLDEAELMERAEAFGLGDVPEEALILTAGVDVQHDRLEVTVCGWTEGDTMLALGHEVIYGDVAGGDDSWQELDEFLRRQFPHRLGGRIGIEAVALDTSDGATNKLGMEFCRARARRRVMAIKGEDGFRRRIIERPTRSRDKPWIVGSDTAKRQLFARLRREPDGEGRGGLVRFSRDLPPVWFEQLVGERLVTARSRGHVTLRFEQIPGRRNEALDCTVYAMAARAALGSIDWPARRDSAGRAEPVKVAPRLRRDDGGWIGGRKEWF
jgi:phage terminase large subunit GpA-like protein